MEKYTYKEYQKRPFICPVCKGKGFVKSMFYEDKRLVDPNNKKVPCRSCKGKGIVWEPNNE